MALCILIIVCGCLITGYLLLKQSNNEIAKLLGIFAAIGMIVALILAPWQFLILLLIPVIISTGWEYYTSQLNNRETEGSQPPNPSLEADEHLIYRGVHYHIDSHQKSDSIAASPAIHKLSYRGSTYFVNADAHTPTPELTTPSVTHELSFRGSTYSVSRTADTDIKAPDS